MDVYLRAKFEVSSIILTSFRQESTKKPTRIRVKAVERYSMLKKKDAILGKVSDFISKYFGPSKDTY